jgi:HSP20 family molecular chaperone IbpA
MTQKNALAPFNNLFDWADRGLSQVWPTLNNPFDWHGYYSRLGNKWFGEDVGRLNAYPKDDGTYHYEVALPGMTADDVSVTTRTVNGGHVLEVKAEYSRKEENFSSSYSYCYTYSLANEIDYSKEPEAEFKNGVLSVVFKTTAQPPPKEEPKRIAVKKID